MSFVPDEDGLFGLERALVTGPNSPSRNEDKHLKGAAYYSAYQAGT